MQFKDTICIYMINLRQDLQRFPFGSSNKAKKNIGDFRVK